MRSGEFQHIRKGAVEHEQFRTEGESDRVRIIIGIAREYQGRAASRMRTKSLGYGAGFPRPWCGIWHVACPLWSMSSADSGRSKCGITPANQC